MADWQRHLDITTEWNQCKADEITVQECAKAIAVKLRALAPFSPDPDMACSEMDAERDELAARFEGAAADPVLMPCELNSIMRDLYDWGDIALDDNFAGKKVCWIATL